MKSCCRILAKAFAYGIWILPKSVYLGLGYLLAVVAYSLFGFRRRLTLANIGMAFPEKTKKERNSIGFGAYCNLGRSLFEYALIPFLNSQNIREHVEIEGAEHLDRALKSGRGVFLLSAHMGNGDIGQVGLALLGYPIVSISKHFKSQWLNEMWFGLRESKGIQYVAEEKSTFQIMRELKNKKVVIFVLDQFMGPPAGVLTRFFGVETGTASGLALLAIRTNSWIVPAYTYRLPGGIVKIKVDPPLDPSSRQGDEGVQQLTQDCNDQIEQWVRLHPEQWMWLHRRWKKFEIR